MKKEMSKGMLWVCLSVVVLMSLATDIFISGFPAMSSLFATKHIGLVISFYLAGIALSQPFYGPLLDRFGRKPVVLIGIFIYIIGSGIALVTNHYAVFLLARFIQAVGACSIIAFALVVIHDTTQGDNHRLTAAMGVLMAIIGVSPAVSPLLGSVMTSLVNWRLSFYFLFVLGCLYFLWILIFFGETQENKNLSAHKIKHVLKNYKALFVQKNFVLFCLTSALAYGVMFSYLTVASLFIIADFGFSVMTLGWVSLGFGSILFVCSMLVPRLVKCMGLTVCALIGVGILVLGSLAVLLSGFIWGSTIYTFALPVAMVVIGVGFVRPVVSTGAMIGVDKAIAGSASAGYNFVTFAGGSLCSAFVGYFSKSVGVFGCFILVISLLAIVVAGINHRGDKWRVQIT